MEDPTVPPEGGISEEEGAFPHESVAERVQDEKGTENYDTTHEERLWGMLAYLLTFFAWIFAPITIYAVKKEQSRFLAFHALQSLYLELAVTVLSMLPYLLPGVPVLIWYAGAIGGLVYGIVAAIKAYDGEWYEIPLIGYCVRKQLGL